MLDPKVKLTAANLQRYKPSEKEERMLRSGMAFLVIKSPFFAHLLYNECKIAYSKDVPYAGTDGQTLFFNMEGLIAKGCDIAEVAWVVVHELGHCFFGDLLMATKFRKDGYVMCKGGKLPYNHEIMNIAEDYRINAMIIDAKIGTKPKNIDVFYDKTISEKGFEAAVDIYEKLYKKCGGDAGKLGGGQFDVHLTPGDVQIKAEAAGQRTQAIAAAVQAAQAAGTGTIPAAVQRIIGDLLDPKVSWQDHLRSTCVRAGGDPQYDWRTIDRRLLVRPNPMYFAKMAHTGAGCVVIAGDTSGSINDKMINRFFGEMNGIVEDLNPAQLIVMWCDSHVGRIDELDEPGDLLELHADVQVNGVNGGGGTAFGPVFKKVEEMDLVPDMLIYLTDAMGSFPEHEPDYPVIWAVIEGYRTDHIPFGTIVEVELS